MGQHRGETLVEILDRHLRYGLTPAVDELLHTLQVLAGLTVGLTGFTNDDALYRLLGQIGLQPVEKLRRRNSRQPACNNLQWVGDCYTCTLLTVIDGQYPRQSLLVREQPGILVSLLLTELVAAAGGIGLVVEGGCHHTEHITVFVLHDLGIIAGTLQALLQTLGV